MHDINSEVILTGLNGGTAVGFLAGVGVQRVLAEHYPGVLLSWRHLDAWRPVLHGISTMDQVVDAVHEDACVWATAPILCFRYLKQEKKGPKLVAGLRAPLAIFRKWLLDRRASQDETSLTYACALMCEIVSAPLDDAVDRETVASHGIATAEDAPLDHVTMETFFDFTSRNAYFLDQVSEIRKCLDRRIIDVGLTHGRLDSSAPRTLYWTPSADTPAAIYTGFASGSLPVAEWLAFRGLVCFPLAGTGSHLEMTACSGRRKQGEFVWPLWTVAVGVDTVRSLVAYPHLERLDAAARSAFGISTVQRSTLTKQADGKTGMFSPARPLAVSR